MGSARELVLGSRVLSLWMGADGEMGQQAGREIKGVAPNTTSWRILRTLIQES